MEGAAAALISGCSGRRRGGQLLGLSDLPVSRGLGYRMKVKREEEGDRIVPLSLLACLASSPSLSLSFFLSLSVLPRPSVCASVSVSVCLFLSLKCLSPFLRASLRNALLGAVQLLGSSNRLDSACLSRPQLCSPRLPLLRCCVIRLGNLMIASAASSTSPVGLRQCSLLNLTLGHTQADRHTCKRGRLDIGDGMCACAQDSN